MTFCFPCCVDRKVVFVFSCTVNACISQFQVRPLGCQNAVSMATSILMYTSKQL